MKYSYEGLITAIKQGNLNDCTKIIETLEKTPETLKTILTNFNENGANPFLASVWYKNDDIFNLILKKTIKYLADEEFHQVITQADHLGRNALMVAAHYGYTDRAKTILNITDKHLDTQHELLTHENDNDGNALKVAVTQDKQDVALLLLQFGANPNFEVSDEINANYNKMRTAIKEQKDVSKAVDIIIKVNPDLQPSEIDTHQTLIHTKSKLIKSDFAKTKLHDQTLLINAEERGIKNFMQQLVNLRRHMTRAIKSNILSKDIVETIMAKSNKSLSEICKITGYEKSSEANSEVSSSSVQITSNDECKIL